MLSIILSLITNLQLTTDWSKHTIKPAIVGFRPIDLRIFLLVSINKNQKTLVEQKLSLLIWNFKAEVDGNKATDFDQILPLLEKSDKYGVWFSIKSAFTGKKFSTEHNYAYVETSFEINTYPLELVFKSIDNNVAELVGFHYNNTDYTAILFSEEDKVLDYIKSLNKMIRIVLIKVGVFVLVVIILIGVISYYCCCRSKKKFKRKMKD